MIGSESYKKFLEAEYAYRKLSLYEKIASKFDFIKLPLPKSLEKKFKEEIEFCHLRITPNAIFSTAIFFPLLILALSLIILSLLNLFSLSMILILVIFVAVLGYYLFTYTSFLTRYFRSKAASEMTLAVVYMAVSLRLNVSLEAAVAFAASNLSGPLGLDLKKLLWDLETRRIVSVIEGLDELSEKWKSESEEFVDAISIFKTAVNEPPERMEKSIKEAVEIMIEGTKARMKKYALSMRSPLKILNAFGILLPMLGLIFFPMIIIFVPEIAKVELLVFGYTFLLPVIVYLFLKQNFYSKPYSFHQIQLNKLENFKKRKKIAFIFSSLIFLTSSIFLFFQLSKIETIFSFDQFLYSYFFVLTLAISVIAYSFLTIFGNLEKNEEIIQMESELPVAFFQLSMTSGIGKPVEKSMEDLLPRIRNLKISELFKKILLNIKNFGMSLENSVFGEKVGVINFYPSRMIYASFKLLVDMAKQGTLFLSLALKTISEFFKDADEVNKTTEEILSETTSDMQIQAWIFAPLSAGIVVGLMAIVIYVFAFFGANISEMEKFFGEGSAISASFKFLSNIGKQVPFHYFQIIVGTYMVEMVLIISYFLGEMNYGEDEVNKTFNLGKMVLIAILVYSATVLSIYFGVTSFIQLGKAI
ncbi:MAG: hypothetical protein QXY24_04135 [Candidatus Aenigmatarchaeota archaeon]